MAGKEKVVKKIKKSENYDFSSGVLRRKNKFCPKCGPGIFLAEHKGRRHCGKCGFMEKN